MATPDAVLAAFRAELAHAGTRHCTRLDAESVIFSIREILRCQHSVASTTRAVTRALLWCSVLVLATGCVAGAKSGAPSAAAEVWSLLTRSDANTQVTATPQSVQLTPVPAQDAARTWSIRIDEATLSREMNAWADAQPPFDTPVGTAGLHNLYAQLSSDQALVQGNVEIGSISAPFVFSVDASVDSGRVLLHLNTARLGGVDVPASVRSELEQRMQDRLDESTRSLHLAVQSVSTTDGALVAQGSWQ